jgi:choline-glycine betaine transporter
VYHHMDNNGWDWFWMVPMMLLWIAVLGGVVYGAVRLGLKHSHQQQPPLQQ